MIVRKPKAKQSFRKVILDVARFIEKDFLAITGLNLDRKRSLGQTLFSVLSPEETQGNCRAEEPKTVGVNIFYDTGGKGIEKLLTFPIHPSMMMMQSEGEAELANVSAENAANFDVADAPETAISDAPPSHRSGAAQSQVRNRRPT